MTIPTLTTSRLILQPLTLDDAPATQSLFPHWEIVRLLNAAVPWPYPSDGVLLYYRDLILPAMARGEQWCWTLRQRETPEQLIGAILLANNREDQRGFWLGLPWHGQGFMTEACEAVTDFWFNTLHQPVLSVAKAATNEASRRISQRQGMRLVRTFEKDYVSGRLPAEQWEITREEWNAQRTS